jgi:hypothetical protein
VNWLKRKRARLLPVGKCEKRNGGGRDLRLVAHQVCRLTGFQVRWARRNEDVKLQNLRYRFGYILAGRLLLRRLAQIIRHNSLSTRMVPVHETQRDLQRVVKERS